MIAFQLRLDVLVRIVEYQLVAAHAVAAARHQLGAAPAAQYALPRQIPRRRMLAVVHRADNDGTVDIAVEKLDQHFLADARQRDLAERLARPWRHDPDPWRTARVELAQPVPVELHLHPAQRVGMDGFACRPGDDRRLQAGQGTRRAVELPPRIPADALADAAETVFIMRLRAHPCLVIVAGDMIDRQDQVFARADVRARRFTSGRHGLLAAEVSAQRETAPGLGAAVIAASFEVLRLAVSLLQAALRQRFAVVNIGIAIAGVLIQFMGKHVALLVQRMAAGAAGIRLLVVEAGQRERA